MVKAYNSVNPVRIFTVLPRASVSFQKMSDDPLQQLVTCCDLSKVSSVVPMAANIPLEVIRKNRYKKMNPNMESTIESRCALYEKRKCDAINKNKDFTNQRKLSKKTKYD